MSGAVKSILELSRQADLEGKEDQCNQLKHQLQQGWKNWKLDLDSRKTNDKRMMEFYTLVMGICPAVHNVYLNDKLKRTGTKPTLSPSSGPSSTAFWNLDSQHYSSDNPSTFPDSFLLSHRLLLMIRHPILSFPSTMRAAAMWLNHEDGLHPDYMNFLFRYHWHRLIYDWCATQHRNGRGLEPLVLDTDDLMYNREVVASLCETLGLDPAKTKYHWQKTTNVASTYDREELFQDVLAASTSIVPGKSSSGMQIDEEFPKWQEEFGEDRAVLLKSLVEDALEDYMYLRERAVGHSD